MDKKKQFNWTFWVTAVLIWLGIQLWFSYSTVLPLAYSDYLTHLEDGQIAEAEHAKGNARILSLGGRIVKEDA